MKFNEEKATVKIRVLPGRYIRLNNKMYHPTKVVVLKEDGNRKVEWSYDSAEVWVTPEVAQELTLQSENDAAKGIRAVATILETRALPTKVKEPTMVPDPS